jgi:hypothetical protein
VQVHRATGIDVAALQPLGAGLQVQADHVLVGGHDQQGLPAGVQVGTPGALRGVAHGLPRSAGYPSLIQVVAGLRVIPNGIRGWRAFPQVIALFGLDTRGMNCLHAPGQYILLPAKIATDAGSRSESL